LTKNLKPVWASFPGSQIRHKVFVPDQVDIGDDPGAFIAARTAAEMLYHRGTLGEERFPVEFVLFRDTQDTEPANRVRVDMDIRPVFFVHG